jgi:hypothetical protein
MTTPQNSSAAGASEAPDTEEVGSKRRFVVSLVATCIGTTIFGPVYETLYRVSVEELFKTKEAASLLAAHLSDSESRLSGLEKPKLSTIDAHLEAIADVAYSIDSTMVPDNMHTSVWREQMKEWRDSLSGAVRSITAALEQKNG